MTSNESSNSSETPRLQFSFGKCKICDDTATGIHYGIATCEGCKGFYKRSLKKHESYFCFQKNNCCINKITRNRCKACRFKKCIKEGMSIDGIRMGRIPKSEKLKSFNELENSDLTKEKPDYLLLQQKEEFLTWFSEQIKLLKNIDVKSGCLNLTLNIKHNKLDSGEEREQSTISNYRLIESSNAMPKSLHLNEEEIFLTAILKDKVFQLYKKHLLNSNLINQTTERLHKKDYIDANNENISVNEVWTGLMGIVSEHTKWLTRFARELPGFNDLIEEDFAAMIFTSTLLLYEIQINRFVTNNENYTILSNRVQMNRKRMLKLFGMFLTELVFEFHSKFKSFELSDYELCMLYPFIMCSCNVNSFREKEKCNQLRLNYTQALVYVFELHGRDEVFLRELDKLFEIVTVLEANRVQMMSPSQNKK